MSPNPEREKREVKRKVYEFSKLKFWGCRCLSRDNVVTVNASKRVPSHGKRQHTADGAPTAGQANMD